MRIFVLLLCAALLPGASFAQPAPGAFTLDSLVGIRHPSRAVWSPAGTAVAFVWDEGGVQNVWLADARPGAPAARPLTAFDTGLVDGLFWHPDGASLLFGRDGDLWIVLTADRKPRRVWRDPAGGGGFQLAPDGSAVAFLRDGDLWVRPLGEGAERRLTETPELESQPVWSPGATMVAFTSVAAERRMRAPAYVGEKIYYAWWERQPSDVGVVPAGGGTPRLLARTPATEAAPRWLDDGRLVLQRVSTDFTTREILAVSLDGGEPRVLHRDVDDKFWSLTYLSPEPVPSPDGRWVAFVSDRSGWDHLYLVPAAGGEVRQLTRGSVEVSHAAWSPDSRRLAYDVNEADRPGVRHLASIAIDDPAASPRMLTTGRGTNTEPLWSPDGSRMAYLHTDPQNPADYFTVDTAGGAAPTRLADSLPASVDRGRLVEPRFVRYPSKDGQMVPAYLFVPPGLDPARRHPAIVWVHGDGVTQNYDGWPIRRDYAVYYSFHQHLAQRGYIVLAVDYRGSIGYGRAWRQGHYRDLGGRDYEDVAAGMDYLRTIAAVDPARVGVWGLSYGGFMTLQALTVTPELFACGIDVAGVVDWRDWYEDPDGPWIKGRMGPPEADPDLYRRTAPIERVDRIVRPLMVLHGMADVNVPYLESVRLIDVALKLGKPVEFMMYPGEFHYFHREHVLRDAWARVQRFFDQHLAAAPRTDGR